LLTLPTKNIILRYDKRNFFYEQGKIFFRTQYFWRLHPNRRKNGHFY
jgi:hypothetical protein